MKKAQSLVATALLCAASATQATILQPTNEDVNFIMAGNNYTLAIFDDADLTFSNALEVDMQFSYTDVWSGEDMYTGSVSFTPWPETSGSSYSVSNGTTSLALGDTTDFFMALYDSFNSTWVTDSAYTQGNGGVSVVEFVLGGEFPATETTVTIDTEMSPVPVPAAAWLFATGLIGLAGVARRSAA